MKKLLTLACSFALLLFSVSDACAAKYTLKMQSYLPTSLLDMPQRFVDRVHALTNGEVKIELYTAGELVSSPNILKSVRSGMIDIGHGMGFHFPEMKTGPLDSGMPMAWMSPVEAEILFERRGLFDLLSKEYEKAGVVYLGPGWSTEYLMLTKKPVRSLEDLRSMKIRAMGATGKMLAHLGVPVATIPPEDLYVALTTGQVDGCVYGSPYDYKETKFYEAAEWLCTTPFIDPINDCFMINPKKFNALPKHIQEAFRSAAYEARWHAYRLCTDQSIAVKEELFKGKMTSLSDEDVREMLKAAVKVWDDEAKRSPEMAAGVEIVKKFAKDMGRL